MGKRLKYRTPVVVAATSVCACLSLFFGWGLHIYWNTPSLINFLAAWIPFVLSVLFAFVPSGKEMKHRWIRRGWRGGVIAVGLFWSVMLWHQQALTDAAAMAANQKLLDSAVAQSNKHSDGRFDDVQKKVSDLGTEIDNKTAQIGQDFDKATGNLTSSITKISMPAPPEHAVLEISLFHEGMRDTELPLTHQNLQANADGTVRVQFVVKNTSFVQAEQVEIWVTLCQLCSFAKEPDGFDKPPGIDPLERHRVIPAINPGVAVAGNVIDLKIDQSTMGIANIGLSFTWACDLTPFFVQLTIRNS